MINQDSIDRKLCSTIQCETTYPEKMNLNNAMAKDNRLLGEDVEFVA